MANETTKCPIVNGMENAINGLRVAVKAAKDLKGCPEQVISRIENLQKGLMKSTVTINNRLAGMGAKADRAAKAEQRKVDQLAKLVAKQAKIAEKIAAMQS